MKYYIFTLTRTEYYKVEAETPESARRILEECNDLADYQDFSMMMLTDIQPEFKLFGVLE